MRVDNYDSVDRTEDGDVFLVDDDYGTKKTEPKNLLKGIGLPFMLAINDQDQCGYINNDTGKFVRFVNPTGTLTVNEKGEFDVTDYEFINMNIPFDLSILLNNDLTNHNTADLCTCRNDDTVQGSDIWDGHTPEDGWAQGAIIPEGFKLLALYIPADEYIWTDWYDDYETFDMNLYSNPKLIEQAKSDWDYAYEIYDQYKVNSNNKLTPIINKITKSEDSSGWSVLKVYTDVPPYSILIPQFKGEMSELSPITWNGLSSFNGEFVWTDGENIYYSYGSNQYVLNKSTSTWTAKTWNGLSEFYGSYIWTDGTNIYYSYSNTQMVLNKSTSTWSAKTWNDLTEFDGINIWKDGDDIYYSSPSSGTTSLSGGTPKKQYVLNKSTDTWVSKTWNGESNFAGSTVWFDGQKFHMKTSNGSTGYSYEYVLDKSTSTWTQIASGRVSSGIFIATGDRIWTYRGNIYTSSGSNNYVWDPDADEWISKTWEGISVNISGNDVWSDGEKLYYSHGSSQYIFNAPTTFPKSDFGLTGVNLSVGVRSTYDNVWADKVWSGITDLRSFNGIYIWTDGTDTYYSNGSTHYVLNKSTGVWETKTWNGLRYFNGFDIWTDGENVYYSLSNDQYVLDKETSTWTSKTWNGLRLFRGEDIWTDGENIYYSNVYDQYVLNKETSTWSVKNWNGIYFMGNRVWSDGENVYYNFHGVNVYDEFEDQDLVLNKATGRWETKTWNDLNDIDGRYIWNDGDNTYYSNDAEQYVLNKQTGTWARKGWANFAELIGDCVWTDGENMYYSNYSYGSNDQFMLLKH